MRIAGWVMLAFAAALLLWFGFDTPLGAAIFALDPPLLNTLQAGIQRRLSPALWNDVIQPVLEAPVWLVPLLLALLLHAIAFWRRRRG